MVAGFGFGGGVVVWFGFWYLAHGGLGGCYWRFGFVGGGCCLSTIMGFGLVACFCGWLLFDAGLGDACGFVGVYCGRFS